jgi:uroporphyrinogen decarboxylase
MIACGFDALHPLEPTAMDIYKIKADYGDRICLCGTLDLSSLAAQSDLNKINEETRQHIQRLAPGGGYCLGSASGISNHIPLEHYLTMNRTCLRQET